MRVAFGGGGYFLGWRSGTLGGGATDTPGSGMMGNWLSRGSGSWSNGKGGGGGCGGD